MFGIILEPISYEIMKKSDVKKVPVLYRELLEDLGM